MYSLFSNLTFSKHIKKAGFNDIIFAIEHPDAYILINTLSPQQQDFLIMGTVSIDIEEKTINELIEKRLFEKYIIVIYGKNSTDTTIEIKYRQLKTMGFTNVYIYYGGLFEWILLQDIYDADLFQTTTKQMYEISILKYKPDKLFI